MGVGFAPAVAGREGVHQPGIELVLHVALEDAVLDQHRVAGGGAFVVDVQGTATILQGTVVHHRAQGRGHLLADAAGEGGTALAVEIALETVTHRLVQQDAGPARAEHHRHGTGRCRYRFEIDQRLPDRLAGEFKAAIGLEEMAVVHASAATGGALFAPLAILGDHRDVEPHQRTHVGGEGAVAGGHQDHFVHAGQGNDDLFHPRIDAPGLLVQPAQQGDLLVGGQGLDRIDRRIQAMAVGPLPGLDLGRLALSGDGPGGAGRFGEGRQGNLVRIGKAGLLAGDGTHAHALVDAVMALAHDAVFQHPGFVPAELEVQIGIVHLPGEQAIEHLLQGILVQFAGRQQRLAGDVQGLIAHVRISQGILRCSSAGKWRRVLRTLSRSISAITKPEPRGRRSRTLPQGSTIMLSPWVSRPLT